MGRGQQFWRSVFAAGTIAAALLPERVHAEHPGEVFLDRYCLDCHDSLSEKGDQNFESLFFPVEDLGGLIETQAIIDQLNLGTMPPRDADQPTEAERLAAVASLTDEAVAARERFRDTGGQTTLRRLNEREYLNTVEALFFRRVDTLDPTATFPTDQTDHHLDTIGDTLVTSSFLLDNFFGAADQIVEAALNPAKRPEVRSWRFDKDFHQGQELSYSHREVYNYRYLCVYEVPNTVNHEGGYAGLEAFPEGVHAAGEYEVKVLAQAMHRDTHYDPEIFQMDFDEPFRLGVVSGDARVGKLHHPQPIEPKLAETIIADGEPEYYTMRVWLEAGQQPRFIFPNGMANCRQAFAKLARVYKKEWPKSDRFHRDGGIVQARRVVLEHGKMPHIRIHEVEIRGPLYDEWPPAPQREILGGGDFTSEHRRTVLERFANRAYRRSPLAGEVDRLVAVANARIESGQTPRGATLDAIKASLCSPSFLYLAEPGEKTGEKLSAVDLATRLSYFVWAAPPDQQLRKLAESGDLSKPATLKRELRRLLDDPRSEGFYEGFLDSWLNLRALGGMPPSRTDAAPYYHNDLESAMKEEAQAFTRHLIESDGSILDFLDADYSFVNHNLAKLYRIDFPYAVERREEFLPVSWENSKRGGLLGMAGVLTVSANGIETSPVTRGVYVLENLLGLPTPPPPDEVPEIEPDTRGTSTIRDELEKHRAVKTCAECHRRIDPPGFALEHFDPIGRWRDTYPAPRGKPRPSIDASGTAPDGSEFNGISEFRQYLLTQSEPFARHLTERLLAYGTGRNIGAVDRGEVDSIVSKVSQSDWGMQTLLEQVVLSEIFRSR
ncbi:MAG: DUF1592 domain-containing protein [Verrucomicrobiota bacterium]